jgi:hypothetical protein
MNFYLKSFIAIVLLFFTDFIANSQSQNRVCEFEQIMNQYSSDPNYLAEQLRIKTLAKLLENNKTDSIYTIPVIVHVIYKNNVENISDNQINSQISALNNDFRKRNADTTIVKPKFPIADVRIEFCLANKKPDGSYTSGIIRIPTTQDNVGLNNLSHIISPSWGNKDYLNIWVCDYGNNIAGRGTPPNTVSDNQDGIVIDYTNFGTTGTVIAPYHLGRTVTHEVGHWLNLFHTWGQNETNPNCSSDDLVTDTPDQSAIYNTCPTTGTSCGSEDMLSNYMGYVYDRCMANFTPGQKTRMRNALLISRSTLINSDKGCSVLSINEKEFSSQIQAFPNPNNGNFEIQLTDQIIDDITIEITNHLGQRVDYTYQKANNNYIVTSNSLPNGIYLLKIMSDKKTAIKKIIISN